MDPKELAGADLRHVWHPFTQADEWEADGPPLIIDRAEGCELIDVHGKRYLDGVSSLWCNVHGHRHPALDAAVKAQLDRVAHSTLLGLASRPSIELATRLVAFANRIEGDSAPFQRAFFSDSGSSAVEVALKIAFQCQQQRGHTERTRFAALSEAYHGDTLGSVSVGGIDLFHEIYRPLLFDAARVTAPDRPDPAVEARLLERATNLFATEGHGIAALVVEPLVQGAAGMRMHSAGWLRRLARGKCHRHSDDSAHRGRGKCHANRRASEPVSHDGSPFALPTPCRRPLRATTTAATSACYLCTGFVSAPLSANPAANPPHPAVHRVAGSGPRPSANACSIARSPASNPGSP